MQKYYIVKHKDREIRLDSRSGGIFTAITDLVLEQNGIVYGCKLNEKMGAFHDSAITKIDRDQMRGSKYIQSHMGENFKKIYLELQKGMTVLFSGTPCQVAGLKSLCNSCNSGELICIDTACHSVASPNMWRAYISYLENEYSGKVTKFNFRNKLKFGWANHIESFEINGKEYSSSLFAQLYSSNLIGRESCFSCPYKSLKRYSDITIADAWGVDNLNDKDFNDDMGVSLAFANSEKGEQILIDALRECEYREVNIMDYGQPALEKAFSKPKKYNNFWENMQKYGCHTFFLKKNKKIILKNKLNKIKLIVKKVFRLLGV